MRSSTAALVAAALCGLTGGIGPAAPAAAQDDDGVITVRACNNSGYKALAAVSYIEPGRDGFVTRGWYDVPAGQCVDLVTTDNAIFYLYADADGASRFWGGSKTLCVQYPGPFAYYHDGSTYCPQDMDTREFIQGVQNEAGVYTFNLGN